MAKARSLRNASLCVRSRVELETVLLGRNGMTQPRKRVLRVSWSAKRSAKRRRHEAAAPTAVVDEMA